MAARSRSSPTSTIKDTRATLNRHFLSLRHERLGDITTDQIALIIDRLRSKRIFTGLFAGSRAETLVLALCFLWMPLTFNFRFAQKIPRQPDGHFNGAIYHNEWQEVAALK